MLANYWQLIKDASVKYGLDAELLGAFVLTESNAMAQRTRYEAKWEAFNSPKTFADALGISLATEKVAQMHSYGLLQVMGATARDLGFRGYLHEICLPAVGIELGARYLGMKRATYTSTTDMIAAYNTGTPRRDKDGKYVNQSYVDVVLKNFEIVKGMHLG